MRAGEGVLDGDGARVAMETGTTLHAMRKSRMDKSKHVILMLCIQASPFLY